jgi:general secretion pathway protein D
MKTIALILILFLTGFDLRAQTNAPPRVRQLPQRYRAPGATNGPFAPATTPALPRFPASPAPAGSAPSTAPVPGSPSDEGAPSASESRATPEETIPAGTINFQGVDVDQVLEVYAQLVGRTLLRAGLPSAKIVLKTQTPLTKTEAIQALQAVLALNGISVVNVGEKFVKVLPSDAANSAAAPIDTSAATNLPEMGSYVTHIVQLKYTKPSEMVPIIQPFAKLPNSILPIDANGILVLRDYAENVKRMLEMIDRVDIGGGNSEFISEVIPIKYALAEDIANALNSLGGSGNSTVSIGTPATSPSISGVNGAARPGGIAAGVPGSGGYQGGTTQPTTGRGFGAQATANGTPTGGTTFQQRLQSIINRASGGAGQPEQIEVFGQAKIIADQRANSLLVFATRQDMEAIKSVVAKLDVLLSQVLIEAVIMDVTLGDAFNFGVSAAQNPKTFSPSVPIVGGGGVNNGQSFLNFLSTNSLFNLGTNVASIFGNALPGGFSYFGNIGPNFDLAVQAAESDNMATIIQRPRIQTSQAKQAQFFVGETKPYVTSTYNGGAGIGQSSSYSQLSVGVELDVTPFINPDGLVVMDINQEIDDFSGFTTIEGVGDVPNTDKRTINSEVAVRDRDTIILGGFVKTDKSRTRSGIPFLMDIPIIGNLFIQRSDNKDRHELVVLMRPTVLKTPEIAAQQAVTEEQRLPGVSAAAAEESADERRLINAERKKEESRAKANGYDDGFFITTPPQETTTNINSLMSTPPNP